MNENLKKLFSLISSDEEVSKKLSDINEQYKDDLKESQNAVIKLAAEYGIELTEADFDNTSSKENQLSEEELDAVAGGVMDRCVDGGLRSSCSCFAGGGGGSDQYQKTCACVGAGCGELTELGKKLAKEGALYYSGSSSAPVAMWCAMVGDSF